KLIFFVRTAFGLILQSTLYQYYYGELNDVEIGNRSGKTSQGVNKRRRRALARIKEAYENM
ncbi:hypothetical protein ABC639_05915, partial [Lacticaseibacillus paracasei]